MRGNAPPLKLPTRSRLIVPDLSVLDAMIMEVWSKSMIDSIFSARPPETCSLELYSASTQWAGAVGYSGDLVRLSK